MHRFASLAARHLTLLLLATWARGVQASPSEQVPVGPRGIAMGGAYSSLALDASALFWNPAGLSWIGHQEVAGTYANLYQSDVRDNYAAFILPISRRHALGIDWYHSGFDDSELKFGENRFDLSWAMQVHRKLSAGVTAKYLTRDTDLDGATVSRGNGVGMDVGALVNPVRGLRVGMVAQDLWNSSIHYTDGGTTVIYPRNVRVGASYGYRNLGTLALDVDDRWHVGAEVRPIELLALRAGMEKDRSGSESATWTTGAGIQAGIFRLDYAYVIHPTLAATSHFGLSMAFNFNPAQVRIEKVEPLDIFASQYKSYARVPFGHAMVRNLSDKLLDCRFRVEIPGLTDVAMEQDLHLRPGAGTSVDLLANLSDRAMALGENSRKPVRVFVSYKSIRLDRTDRLNSTVTVYAPGAINWNNGVEQAAAFITTDDPIIDSFASGAVRAATRLENNPFVYNNVANAAAIFDAVNTIGVIYQADPNDPYPTISQQENSVDRVNYPRQTLAKRSGDCDDTSVLFAALLGHVGIRTMLVDVPGHLFLMFDAGRPAKDHAVFGVDEDLLVEAEGRLWIPLETTALKQGFAEAWRQGAEKYASSKANQTVNLVDVPGSQAKFESGLPPGTTAVPAVDQVALDLRLGTDAGVVAGWRRDYVRDHFAPGLGSTPVSAGARDEMAHMSYLGGQIDDAVRQLEIAAREQPGSARALNNLGNARAVSGDPPGALEAYAHALERDPNDAGIWLNRGLLLHAVGDTTAAATAFARGVEQSGGYVEACRILGLEPEGGATREGTPRMTSAQIRRMLRAAMKRIPALDSLRATDPAKRPTGTLRPLHFSTGGPRGTNEAESADLRSHLYWRERE